MRAVRDRRLLAAAAAVALAAVAVVALVAQGDSRDRARELQTLLDEIVDAGAPGALALVQTGEDRWRGASGTAEVASGAAMRRDLTFRIGSITKTYVAALVLQLVAEDRLRLDDPVERWVPGAVPRGITVRHLLGHASGLFDYTALPEFASRRPRALVAAAVRERPALDRPGNGYAYSSTNYLVLGLVVEAVTGAALDSALEHRIFTRFGLNDTRFASGRLVGAHVHGYRPAVRDGIVIARPGTDTSAETAAWAWAAGAIVSTADDTARFFATLLRGRVIPPRLVDAMATPSAASGGRYGLGLAVFRTPCGPAWGHTGNLLGHVSVVWSARDGRRLVVLAANSFPLGADGERAARRFLEAAYCGK